MSAVHLSQVSTRNKRAVFPFLRVLPLILLLLWRDRASVSVLLAFRLSQDTWSENPWLLNLHVPNRSLSWWQTGVSFPPILPGISHAEGTGRLCAALGSSAASLPERGPGHAVTVLGRCPWGGTARKCGHQNISLLSLARYQNGWGILVWNAAFLMSCYVFDHGSDAFPSLFQLPRLLLPDHLPVPSPSPASCFSHYWQGNTVV